MQYPLFCYLALSTNSIEKFTGICPRCDIRCRICENERPGLGRIKTKLDFLTDNIGSLSSLANLPLHVRDALKSYDGCGTGNGNALLTLPTMWIGLQNYFIHVHSAVSNWSKCLRRVKMPDAVLSILHLNGRLFAALANGSIAVFHRNTRGEWSDTGYFLVKLGSVTSSVCHLCAVEGNVWAACRNCVMVLDPVTLKIKHIITAHPRKDSQVRQMICCGRGVWLSIRLDSCIRLFHSENFQHLQDVDVEPEGTRKSQLSSPTNSKKQRTYDIDMDLMNEKRKAERRQHYRTVSQYMKQEEFPNAYGTVWCAAPSALHGGLRDGEYIVGDPISSCDPDLLLREKEAQLSNDSEKRRRRRDSALLEASSLLWVCGSDEQRSFVSVLDANQPSNILAGFSIEDANVLCVASAAGIRERDSRLSDEGMSVDSELCTTGEYLSELQIPLEVAEDVDSLGSVEFIALQKSEDQEIPTYSLPDEKLSPKRKLSLSQSSETNGEAKRSLSSLANLPLHVRDALKSYDGCGTGNGNALLTLPTMHLNGRLFAALANGSIAVFHRNTRGEWSDTGYFLVKLGSVTSSVCHLCAVEGNVWAACRNCVMVLDPVTLKIKHIITAHPRKDSQVRQMICCGRGVWLSIRLDSCIRLFHSENFQHLQDVDVEPFISKMLGANQLDSHLRITSLSELNRRIWVGTGSGIIVSIPLKEKSKTATVVAELVDRGRTPGQVIRVHSSDDNDSVTCATTPFCDITNAQLSFHGHKDAVRFLLPLLAEGFSDLTQSVETKKALMVSGGDGYIDFRLGDEDEANEEIGSNAMTEQIRARDLAHLLIWETECPVRQLTGHIKDQ
uniref:WD_REPEATS_REGION domain-containing protein n=1 Tax=Globodera pallida TaxID=36090 RepID=A0A183CLW4_GLOPA